MLFDSVTFVLKKPFPSMMKLMHKQYMSPFCIPIYFKNGVLLANTCFDKKMEKNVCKFISIVIIHIW